MKTNNDFPQEPCICIKLRRITQKVTDLYDKALSPMGITVNQYSLLVNIGRIEGCCISELASQVKQEKSTLVRTLQPLFRDELIFDSSSAENRKRQLFLTTKGKATLKKAIPLWSEVQEEVAGKLGPNYEELMCIFEQVDSWR